MTKLFQSEEIRLSNGIPVVYQHADSAVAATYWWIQTGSADESPQEAGYAHFLEHMLFKDAAAKETGRASTGQMARVIESFGGEINAYTSFDQTVYHVTCAAQHWEKVLAAFSQMAKPQKFFSEDFEREREVILEELRKNEDSPNRQLFQTLFSGTFGKHPYGKPVIGFEKVLKAATPSKLESFYRKNYTSDRMGIVLVGPLKDEKRKKAFLNSIEKYFGSKVIRRSKGVLRTRPREPELRDKPSWAVKNFDVRTPSMSLSFRVPELNHEDLPALDLLAGILGMGELSRLYQRLFYRSSLVTDVSGSLYVPRDAGMLIFQAEVDSAQKLPRVGTEIFQELKRMSSEGPTSEELERVLVNAESERLYATQTADGIAGRLGFLRFVMGDLDFDQNYLDDLRGVNSQKIKEAARKYLDFRRMTGVLLLPKSEQQFDPVPLEKEAIQTLEYPEALVPSAFRPSLPKSTSKKQTSAVPEIIRLPSGITLCFYPRPTSKVMSVHASVLGGLRLETTRPVETAERDWGSGYLLSMGWTKGTGTYTSRQISTLVEGKAAGLEGFSGRNSAGLQMTGLARDWDVLTELFTDVLLDPRFPVEEVEHAKRIAEDSINSVEDHSSQLCSKLFLETLFEIHPYGKMVHGSLESLKTIHSEKLKAFHRRWLSIPKLVLSVSGAIKENALEAWVQQVESRAKTLLKPEETVEAHVSDEPDLKAPRWVEKALGREQLHIIVGGLGSKIHSEDRFAIRLLQTLLGGQSGRLFIELREKKSLAYTVAPVSFEGLERGYIGTYIACAPQKRDEALFGIRSVLEKLAEKGPQPREIKRAKEFFLGRRAMDLQSDSALASHFGLETLYQVPHYDEKEMIKKVNSVTGRQIQKVCQKYLVEPFMVTSVVG